MAPPAPAAQKPVFASPSPATVPAAPAALTPALPSPTAATPPTIGGAPPADNSATAGDPAPVRTPAALKPKKAAPPPPREAALSDDPRPTLQSNTFFATAKASERYGAIVDAGGWPTNIIALRPGAKGPAVAQLRKRLSIEGYLDPSGANGEAWDAGLTAAVKRFQSHMGLRQTGVVAGATLKAINVSARVRFKQLASSADRLAGINFPFGERYVVVNLPSTTVEAVENDRVVHRYVAIVGDPGHPSPEIAAQIQVININPTWTVPSSIIKKEIIPRMQRDPGYLTRAKIRILDGSGKEIDPKAVNWSTERAADYTLRQDSGVNNSLGSIRIGMPNKLAVYMHDTPSKRLFGADYRFLSHGCVRVQGVFDYAEWLLRGTSGGPNGVWDKAALEAKVKEGLREDIRLAKAVPVIWVYLTGWSNDDGPANFRDDVYSVDAVGDAQASVQPSRAMAQ
jgi:L,D-transpeptidase YcbB